MLLDDALVVRLNDITRDTFHSKNLDVQPLTVRKRVFDICKSLFMDLIHMNIEPSSRVQSTAASLTLKVLSLLVRYKNLQIVKVALTIVAPWTVKLLL